ncbi:MFS transporter [Pseudarthrobacter sp. J64]|uniref:MFS transporter n=1 Tax=Pseudarthrobacter sp. J64 TaxID=3116485 RepID=UPI002E808A6A|nr:MFS transporter [Pseudarthrobacter sp. J64]MEE2570522.1 MFS transporter [Pseudarthrobacter sp. J64]
MTHDTPTLNCGEPLTDHSGTAVGITTGLQFLPMLLLGPYSGVLADRHRKRRILLWTQSAMGLCALVVGLLVVLGAAQLWQIYVAALCLGIASAFDGPARQAFVSEVVPRKDLPNAVALNSASFNTGRLAGPAVAGLLIAWIGTGPVFLLNAASFVAVILSLVRIRPSELFPATPMARGKRQVAEGLRYVRSHPEVVTIMALVGVVAGFSQNFQVTNALMATTEFGLGPGEFGLLGTIMAIGTLAAALMSASRPFPRLRFLLGGALGLGFFSLLASVSPSYWLYATVMAALGFALMTFLNSCNTRVQLSVDPQFRGRVMALYLTVLHGGTALGAPLLGWVATEVGVRWTIAGGGVVVLLAAGSAFVAIRRRARSSAAGEPLADTTQKESRQQ